MWGTLYKVTHVPSGRVYVGQTQGKPQRRWKRHLSLARNSPKQHLHRAIAKYGESYFKFEILWEGECSRIELDQYEIFQIKFWRSNELGFNETIGGFGTSGFKMAPETIEKVIRAIRGKRRTVEQKKRISESKKGRSNGHTGLKRSEYTRFKQSLAKRGKVATATTRLKMSIAQKGKRHSEETKQKIAQAARVRWEKKRATLGEGYGDSST